MKFQTFVEKIETVADTFGRPLIGKAAKGYWSALWGLREQAFDFACHKTITTGDRMPTPGQLKKTAEEWFIRDRMEIWCAPHFTMDPRRERLRQLEKRRNGLADGPYTTDASRDLENVDAEIEKIWDEIEAEVKASQEDK